MTEITPDRLADRLADEDDGIFVLDIRPEEEYEAWHIPGSENIPIYDLLTEDPGAADPALSTLPRDAEIVTVCAAGVVSQKATDRLRTIGYDAKTLVDGMQGWSRLHRRTPVGIDIDGTLVQVARPGTGCLSHVLLSDGEAAVYDPSQYVSEYESIIDEYDADLVGVFDTHAHADHVSGGRRLRDDDGSPIATRSRTTFTPTTPTGSTPQR
ncbi:Rhodanese-related sulfurtransferase [Halobiforma haloterrestris]|uniref:Rhodanese-related sulfurtransferase n=1 Tax=Natronobacterium haloterrestre TaxID=148448 RepID=A0A1I1LDQ5_NATHA|nr:Rhodanese-related sulfurtransferase [Halobiforma haloterrestris]